MRTHSEEHNIPQSKVYSKHTKKILYGGQDLNPVRNSVGCTCFGHTFWMLSFFFGSIELVNQDPRIVLNDDLFFFFLKQEKKKSLRHTHVGENQVTV